MAPCQSDSFSFVAYNGPEVIPDPNVRRLIRQQAMKNAAAERKRKRRHGQHNLGQYPTFLKSNNCADDEDLSIPESFPPQSVAPSLTTDPVSPRQDLPAKSSAKHGQNQRAIVSCHRTSASSIPRLHPDFIVAERFSLLLHLAPLTGLRLGIAQFSHTKSESGRVGNSLPTPHLGNRKLLCFISSRYGYVSSLSHATDCVVAKLQQMIQPLKYRPAAEVEANVLLHYTKALRALQVALDDETQRTTAETLCATELLGVFEVCISCCPVNP